MKSLCVCGILVLQASSVFSCAKDYKAPSFFNPQVGLQKRQETQFPPVLTEQEAILVNSIDNVTLEEWNYYYAHSYHLAGTNRTIAQWTADRWGESGFDSRLVEYHVYLDYPISQSVTLTYENGSTFEATLIEDVLPEDDVTGRPDRIPAFHGYSFSGDAEAEYVYAGRGQKVDFERLEALNISVEGKIVLARYGGPFRGLKVKNAQDRGAVGVVIFTDTADDGNITEANGYAAYPDGPARHPSAIQRGSVQFLSTHPGDPTTPGYPSTLDAPRQDISDVTPQIPSIPVSWVDGQKLLWALDGHGVDGETVNRTNWVGKLNATYSTGPAPGNTISLSNNMEEKITPIWNVVGVLNGTSEDEVIIVGNHRDAWIIGGAVDPNSGSAVLVELAKAFGKLQATGWKPRRTIVLASWDAEEYGLVGSTEWVEENLPWLSDAAVAYLNIDVATSGPDPDFSATPDIQKIALDTMKKVVYPYRGYNNLTLYDVFYGLDKAEFGVLGSGSDYTGFLHNGISSIDIGTGNGPTDPVYQYHSAYDTWHWVTTYGDPDYIQHKVVAQWVSLLLYHLSTQEIIPLDVEAYGVEMTHYYDTLVETLEEHNATVNLTRLEQAIATFNESAAVISSQISAASTEQDYQSLNYRLKTFSRGFVSQGGLPNREFYKHVVFAPGLDTGYAPVEWPGITEGIIEYKNESLAQQWVEISARGVEAAAAILA
ncbi:hypothetical protein PV10_02290 [Exophiala mesophila]|uniref:Glutamate carboxypeptidase n=1 Tax=Exophiala mesophila TaxID=212818 RepID=A0A0D1ZKW7_EXOME|nr:uncharacterized protein PV10_02290 [Exophiala mesophila]KIV94534.1 hypothetical protein PV10_02290 [Exophiala mesophila]